MQDNTATKAYFDEWAARWDEMHVHDPQKLAALVTLAGVAPGQRVLDVACGTGVLFPELLSHNPASVLGIDLSDKMIEVARQKCADPRVTLLAGDVLELTQGGFDVITIYSAYPHFPDKAALVEKMASLLVPGGRFLVAHSESKETINGRHQGPAVGRVSVGLQPVAAEADRWGCRFVLDLWGDNQSLYFFSGTRR